METYAIYRETSSQHRGLRRPLCAALLALAVAIPAAAVAAAAPQGGIALHDGVVVDAARSAVYVMHPQGGIDALDLTRGAVIWHSAAAERPLLLTGDLLVAQARPGEHGELAVVALDVRQGNAHGPAATLALPPGVRAEVAETVERAFRVHAVATESGVVLAWQAHLRVPDRMLGAPGGAAAGPAVRKNERGSLAGTASFDPATGRLAEPKAAELGRVAAPRPVLAATLASPDATARRFSSVDRRHVLESRQVGDAAAVTPYRWTITEAATGKVVGAMDSRVSMAPFTVAGTRLFHVAQPSTRMVNGERSEQPLRLRAVDLATGRELWSREIRDTKARGPQPR